MKQEFEIPSGSPAAIPYKWEAAPGRPIVEAASQIEPWMSPLRPPPGVRRASGFDGFEPELPELVETQLAGKILKKLNRLRRKSMVAAACFTPEVSRVIEHSGQLFAMEDLDRCHDSDAMSRCSMSTCDQRRTPRYSTSVDSSFSEPFRTSNMSSVAVPSSPYTTSAGTSARPSSYCRFEDGDCLDEGNESDDDKTLPGPSESAWHQPHGEEIPTCVPQKLQMRSRSYSNHIPTILRQVTSSRSFKHLILARTFRKSKTAKQLDFET